MYVKNGFISELPRSNVFIVSKENELITPDSNVLHGVTRKHILQLASKVLTVKEQPVQLDELLNANEVFVSSTTKRLLPVLSVNGLQIATGKAGTTTGLLYQRFLEFETKQ